MDLNGRKAAVSGRILRSSNEADGNAEFISDLVNEEVGGQTSEQLDEGHGQDVEGGPDNIGEARKLRSRTILNAPPSARSKKTCHCTGHAGLGANIASVEDLPQVLIGGNPQKRERESLVSIECHSLFNSLFYGNGRT